MLTLTDDTYTGARWRYGLQYRAITQYLGCRDLDTDAVLPWIIFSDRPSADPRFRTVGTFDCAAELSPRTAEQLQLVPLGPVHIPSVPEEADDDFGAAFPEHAFRPR